MGTRFNLLHLDALAYCWTICHRTRKDGAAARAQSLVGHLINELPKPDVGDGE